MASALPRAVGAQNSKPGHYTVLDAQFSGNESIAIELKPNRGVFIDNLSLERCPLQQIKDILLHWRTITAQTVCWFVCLSWKNDIILLLDLNQSLASCGIKNGGKILLFRE